MTYVRFQRRIALIPGLLYLNLGKKGVSISIGKRGFRVTWGKQGLRFTAGLPGTGLSVSKQVKIPSAQKQDRDK